MIVKPIKFSMSFMTPIQKLEAYVNHKFHADKSFGSVGYLMFCHNS